MARDRGVLPGIFTALHTFGRDLKYNAHVHLSVTLAGLSAAHSIWKPLYFPKAKIMPQWRYGVITLLRQAYIRTAPSFYPQHCKHSAPH